MPLSFFLSHFLPLTLGVTQLGDDKSSGLQTTASSDSDSDSVIAAQSVEAGSA